MLGVALLLVFLLGRATGGASDGQIQELEDRVASLQAQNDQLQAQARARATASPTPTAPASPGAPGAAASPATDGTTTTSPSPGATTGGTSTTLPAEYTVQPDETYSSISLDFYGSSTYARCIMQANGESDASALQSGQEITIPEQPENPCS